MNEMSEVKYHLNVKRAWSTKAMNDLIRCLAISVSLLVSVCIIDASLSHIQFSFIFIWRQILTVNSIADYT